MEDTGGRLKESGANAKFEGRQNMRRWKCKHGGEERVV